MKATQALIIALAAALAAGTAQSHEMTARAALGEKIELSEGVVVEPRAVIEDSRCPIEARCIAAGRVVLAAEVMAEGKAHVIHLTAGTPQSVSGGMLVLQAVEPPRHIAAPAPQDYRFSFAFLPL
jgi:UDP-3-O-[3-hydroxymyristoyl] glucosamine N-acyltransferase